MPYLLEATDEEISTFVQLLDERAEARKRRWT